MLALFNLAGLSTVNVTQCDRSRRLDDGSMSRGAPTKAQYEKRYAFNNIHEHTSVSDVDGNQYAYHIIPYHAVGVSCPPHVALALTVQ